MLLIIYGACEAVDAGIKIYNAYKLAEAIQDGDEEAIKRYGTEILVDTAVDAAPLGAFFTKLGMTKVGLLIAGLGAKVGDNVASVIAKVDSSLLKELAAKGVKHTPEDVLFTHKMSDGTIVFLEKGHNGGGLEHILTGHASDFVNKGIPEDKVADVIFEAVSKNKVVGKSGTRSVYAVDYGGSTKYIAIGVGGNGYVVTAHPVNKWK